MTAQTNNSAYWLDVANVAEQAVAASADWANLPKGSEARDAMLCIHEHATRLRVESMHLRNALMVAEIEAVTQLIEEASDASC